MSSLNAVSRLANIDLYTSDTTVNGPFTVGQIQWGSNGKAFRYALTGASALVKGNVLQASVADTQFDAMAVGTAGVVGDNRLQITNGTTTIVPNQYIGGTIAVTTAGASVALGDEYTITAITGVLTTGGALQVYLDRPLRYAYPTATTKVDMKPNPWSGVIQSNGTTATSIPVGVAIFELPAASYGWVQTHGLCSVLCDGTTLIVGSDLSMSITVAGAAGVGAVISGRARIGMAMQANSSGHAIPAFLQID